MVANYEGDMLGLKDSDHFILLMKLIPGFDLRLKIITFKNTYDDEIKAINDIMESAFDLVIFLKENEKFMFMFERMIKFKKHLEIKDDKYIT